MSNDTGMSMKTIGMILIASVAIGLPLGLEQIKTTPSSNTITITDTRYGVAHVTRIQDTSYFAMVGKVPITEPRTTITGLAFNSTVTIQIACSPSQYQVGQDIGVKIDFWSNNTTTYTLEAYC